MIREVKGVIGSHGESRYIKESSQPQLYFHSTLTLINDVLSEVYEIGLSEVRATRGETYVGHYFR